MARAARPVVEFRFLIGEDAFPASHLSPRDLLEHWLSAPALRCCSILGGFAIELDGQPWNGDCLDEVRMAAGWLFAVKTLLQGATQVQTWVWEESALRLVRRGDLVEMFDVHHSGHIVCPRAVVSLRELAMALVMETRRLAILLGGVLRLAEKEADPEQLKALRENLGLGWAESADVIEAALTGPIPQPPASDPGPPPAMHLAILLDEPTALAAALAREGTEVRADRTLPVHLAIRLKRAWAVAALVDAGADLEALDDNGDTPLLVACQHGNAEAVDQLLAAGASATQAGRHGDTPLRRCVIHYVHGAGIARMWDSLVAAGASPDLFSAVCRGQLDEAMRLADNAPRFPDLLTWVVRRLRSETYPNGDVSTRWAAWRPVFEALLVAGASWTHGVPPPLHEAVHSKSWELVNALLSVGANAGVLDSGGMTALQKAEYYHLEAIADRLRRAG